jgi:hypothetical protein
MCSLLPSVCALIGQKTEISGTATALIPHATITKISNETGARRPNESSGDGLRTERVRPEAIQGLQRESGDKICHSGA